MIEGNTIQPEIKSKYASPLTLLNSFSEESAEINGLDLLQAEGLRKFATARYRIHQLQHRVSKRSGFFSFPISSDMNGDKIILHPEDIPNQLYAAKQIAFSIWDEYLTGNSESESAANEVIIFANNLFADPSKLKLS